MIDPLLKTPLFAALSMSLAASLMGVLIFFRRQALITEVLSHATYPGIALSLLIALFFPQETHPYLVLMGSFLFALAAQLLLFFLHKKTNLKEDSAYTFVLSSFFGLGVLIASFLQAKYPLYGKKMAVFLYGGLMTMEERYLPVFIGFAILVTFLIILSIKELKIYLFDAQCALISKCVSPKIELFFFLFIPLSVVMAMRSVGLVLLSAMLVTPTLFARSFSDRFERVLLLAALSALFSGGVGVILSHYLSLHYKLSLATGPMIIFVSSTLALIGLFFSPKRGLFIRFLRIQKFHFQMTKEHLLKLLWKDPTLDFKEIQKNVGTPSLLLKMALRQLRKRGFMEEKGGIYFLTDLGEKKGAKIVRLHRLWELYLVKYLGYGVDKVHKSAEEIEHILSGSLEEKLEELLCNPQKDPHNQPIPQLERNSFV